MPTQAPPRRGPVFLVLSEDRATSAVATVAALTRSLCREALPGVLLMLPRRDAMTPRQSKGRMSSPAEVDELMSKLVVLTPFYSVESWTYYNTAVLRRLCKPHEQAKVDQWGGDPSQLEEIERIGEQLAWGKSLNRQLAEERFPSAAMHAGKSFADTVMQIRASAPLMQNLSRILASTRWSKS